MGARFVARNQSNMKFTFIAISFFVTVSASASEMQVSEGSASRALQQARRVASMENDNDLPSRAFKLGQRVAKKFKVAYQVKPGKASSKKSATSQD